MTQASACAECTAGHGPKVSETTALLPMGLTSPLHHKFSCDMYAMMFAVSVSFMASLMTKSLLIPALACTILALVAAFSPTAASETAQQHQLIIASTVAFLTLAYLGGHDVLGAALWGTPGIPLVPYHCIVMFFGSAYLCISLEQTGLLRVVASSLVARFAGSPKFLFVLITLLAGILTVFLPDDVVTMAMAPAVCDATREAGLDAHPFMFALFFAANSLSIALVTGNPTNVLVSEAILVEDSSGAQRSLSFGEFAAFCSGPAVVGGLVCALVTYVHSVPEPAVDTGLDEHRKDLERMGVGLVATRGYTCFCALRLMIALLLCTFDWATGLPAFAVIVAVAASAFAVDVVLDVLFGGGGSTRTSHVLQRMPWELLPFLAVLLMAAECVGRDISLDQIVLPLNGQTAEQLAVLCVGLLSVLTCQVLSSVPMSLLFIRSIVVVQRWSPGVRGAALLAIVAGSNLGGIGTPVGCLGSQMFLRILEDKGVPVTPWQFSRRGLPAMLLASAAALTMFAASFRPIAEVLQLEFVESLGKAEFQFHFDLPSFPIST